MSDVSAPLAQLDSGEDWQEFSDFRILSSITSGERNPGTAPSLGNMHAVTSRGDARMSVPVDNVNVERRLDNARHSTTPLNGFPELTDNESIAPDVSLTLQCFRSEAMGDTTEIVTQEKLLRDSPVWHRISETFNGAMPVHWNKSYTRQLQEHALNLKDYKGTDRSSELGDLSDDEELQQALDLHTLIVSSGGEGGAGGEQGEQEPVVSADQVISEIEEMMQESMSMESQRTLDGPSKTAELIRLKLKHALPVGTSVKDCLTQLSVSDLAALVEELEYTVSEYSEVLVQELALREELALCKETNNTFISLLLSIQRKRRELEADKRKGIKAALPGAKKQGEAVTPSSSSPSGTYLTTVIPYDHHEGVPDVDRLQIYIKIMTAIDNDSPTVPAILTDYILKVLCPNT